MEFSRKPEDPDRIVEPVDDMLIIAEVPDYVNLPPELGGGRADVLDACYLEFRGTKCLHYKLDAKHNGKHIWVAKADQFYWHTRD